MLRVLTLLAASLLVFVVRSVAADERLTFEKHIRPIFKAHCFQCHGEGDELKGNLDLRLRRLVAKGGDTGTAIVEGKADESLLVQRIRNGEMPPAGKPRVPATEVAVLTRWIAGGANTASREPEDPAAVGAITAEERSYWAFQPIRRAALPAVQHADSARSPVDAFLLAKLEPLSLTLSPEAAPHTLIRRATFDLFGLPPAPDEVAEFVADAAPDAFERLIDRLLASPNYGERWGRHWLDVAGYADSDGYSETDPVRPYAYKYRDYVVRALNADKPFDEFIVEQLAGDELPPLSPPYANLTADQIDKLVATGFLRSVPDGTASGAGPKEAGNAVIAETIKVVSTSLLGLTVGCAQCHDHRYDPIPQTDYYRLRAIFEPAFNLSAWRTPPQRRVSLYTDADRAKAAEIEAEAVKLDAERNKKQDDYIAKTLDKELAKIAEDRRAAVRAARTAPADKRTPEQTALLKEFPSVNVDAGSLYLYDPAAAADLKKEAEAIAAVRATKPVEDFISCLTEVPGQIPETKLFFRGDVEQPKQSLPPGELTVLDAFLTTATGAPAIPPKDPALLTTGRRLAYARHLTSGQHPLVPRVLVNRAWLHHFGRGIVATPGDFGALGERPTHPELLDWLAAEFGGSAECGVRNAEQEDTSSVPRSEFRAPRSAWSFKHLHRLLMTSAAYRQTSQRSASAEAVDPDNRLLSRMNIRRLEAEAVRDTILAVNGELNAKQLGPAVPVMEDDVGQILIGIENKNGENRPGPIIPMHGEDFRRSIYVQVRRTRPLGMLDPFDLPIMEPNCIARSSSTVTPQSLMLMNSDFVLTSARQLAARLRSEAGPDLAAQATFAWQLVFARPPSDVELQTAVRFLTEQTAPFAELAAKEPDAAKKLDPTLWACATFCQALLSSNEFLYVE